MRLTNLPSKCSRYKTTFSKVSSKTKKNNLGKIKYTLITLQPNNNIIILLQMLESHSTTKKKCSSYNFILLDTLSYTNAETRATAKKKRS